MARKNYHIGGFQEPLPGTLPDATWTPPTSLPDIPSGIDIAVDTETKDEGLASDRGPGWALGMGHVIGVSMAWGDQSTYIPIAHPDSNNFDRELVADWTKDAMARARSVKFQNEAYDRGWLGTMDVDVPLGKTDDTYVMGVMLDENRDQYDLDSLCRSYDIPGKDESELRLIAQSYGINPKKDMWRLPARYVGRYASQDATATLQLASRAMEDIRRQQLDEAYRTEMDLIPMVVAMRKRGIRVDESRAEQVQGELRKTQKEVVDHLRGKLGWRSLSIEDVRSPATLMKMFDQEGLTYPRTPKTNVGSFKSEWMEKSDHWLPQGISQMRKLEDLVEKFIGNYILGYASNGRIHAEIHQLRDDEGGTRSYRFSYSDPPLQQVPARSVLAPLVRSIFLPERGTLWLAADYSQQEPRMAVHFAALCGLVGSAQAVEYYMNNAEADFHTMVAELTGLSRSQAKIINLALMYGMGLAKLCLRLGVSITEGTAIVEQYHARMPFVKALNDFCMQRAEKRGFIRLLDGARSRFDLWEPTWRPEGEPYMSPRDRASALQTWPDRSLRRAFTHKAMNRLVQGSSARQTKLAMLAAWKAGYLPLLQMHDELDFPIETEAGGREVMDIMRNVVPLRVPMKVDGEYGINWGRASKVEDKKTKAIIYGATYDEARREAA